MNEQQVGVVVSLPSIARDLGAAFSDIEWVVSGCVLTFAALLMPSGALADRCGYRRIALIGILVFTLLSCSAVWRQVPSSSIWRARSRASAERYD
jgi:MFS family permease